MSRHRNRINRPDAKASGLHLRHWPPAPAGASVCGFVHRGSDVGRLIFLAVGNYVLQMPFGSLMMLDQRKVLAMLESESADD